MNGARHQTVRHRTVELSPTTHCFKQNSRVIKDLDEFKELSDVIVANRMSDDIPDAADKVYTRDLFSRD